MWGRELLSELKTNELRSNRIQSINLDSPMLLFHAAMGIGKLGNVSQTSAIKINVKARSPKCIKMYEISSLRGGGPSICIERCRKGNSGSSREGERGGGLR